MGGFNSAYRDAMLNAVMGSGTPASVFARLTTTEPTAGANGTQVDAADWTNYAPVEKVNNATNFPAASGGAQANGTIIDFGTATIPGTRVTVVGVELWTLASGGSRVAWAVLTTPQDVNNGNPVTFAIGALTFTAS